MREAFHLSALSNLLWDWTSPDFWQIRRENNPLHTFPQISQCSETQFVCNLPRVGPAIARSWNCPKLAAVWWRWSVRGVRPAREKWAIVALVVSSSGNCRSFSGIHAAGNETLRFLFSHVVGWQQPNQSVSARKLLQTESHPGPRIESC